MREFFRKQRPLLGLEGSGGGLGFFGGASAIPGMTASGGVINDYTDPGPGTIYRAHVFTSSGTFTVTDLGELGTTVEYLVVAGGGSGGAHTTVGGGGAGGVRTNLSGNPYSTSVSFPVSAGPTSYTVTIGGGGAGIGGPGANGISGTDSYFGPPSTPAGITAKGGGYGGKDQTAGGPGGSGGGCR